MTKTEVYILKRLFTDGEFYVTNRTEAKAADKLLDHKLVEEYSRERTDGSYVRMLSPAVK